MTAVPNNMPVIGVVRSLRRSLADTPVQSALNPDEAATVEIDPAFVDGLEGLQDFDYAWLLAWLGQSTESQAAGWSLRQVPLLLTKQPRELGIFATRGPRRVNPIGLSLVKILAVDGHQIHFSGVDLLDGTPIIDIKPYVSAFDFPPDSPRCGWFDHVELPHGATPNSLR